MIAVAALALLASANVAQADAHGCACACSAGLARAVCSDPLAAKPVCPAATCAPKSAQGGVSPLAPNGCAYVERTVPHTNIRINELICPETE